MITPVDLNTYSISQRFGVLSDAYKQFGLAGHNGLDIRTPTGTPIVAPISGVLRRGNDPKGYGNYIRITNAKWDTVLGHLKSISVRDGDTVVEGQPIGFTNNTGYSTGAHLHWGVRPIGADKNDPWGGYVDPLVAIKETGMDAQTERDYRNFNWTIGVEPMKQLAQLVGVAVPNEEPKPEHQGKWVEFSNAVIFRIKEMQGKISALEGTINNQPPSVDELTFDQLWEAVGKRIVK
jgi:murein DD-endopeptidase MepM/ murein hydrolase activator NlpD